MTAEHGFKALKGDLKYLIPFAVGVLILILNVGYYVEADENSSERRYFLKKTATFQLKFRSLYSHVSWRYDVLTVDQKKELIEYCKYRWGIVTDLDYPSELEACSGRKT